METGLQRSQQTFRRSGSSGLVWDERFISGEAAAGEEEEEEDHTTLGRRQGSSELRRSQSTGSSGGSGGRQRWRHGPGAVVEGGFRAGTVAPAADPPSPDVHGCAFCGILGGGCGKSKSSGGKRSARPRRR